MKLYEIRAFTLIELIVVIVILGIVSGVLIPTLHVKNLAEAANNILSAIRYTQHLAIIDDTFRPNDPYWYSKRWRIVFRQCHHQWFYMIVYDKNPHNATGGTFFSIHESAIDPLTKKHYYLNQSSCVPKAYTIQKILLTKEYGISDITFSCKNHYIGFDEIGRPYNNLYGKHGYELMHKDCNITFLSSEGNFTIVIAQETGFATIHY